jgi:hypothetical protein
MAEDIFPCQVLRLFQTCKLQNQQGGETERKYPMHPLIQPKTATRRLLIMSALVWFGLSAVARAVSPAPDGGYAGGNTAEGQNALLHLTTGGFNTAVGFLSLRSNTTGSFGTAIGAGALFANTAGQNTAVGAGALFSNTTGVFNTANGAFALFSSATGNENTAIGFETLFANTTGAESTAVGYGALSNNTIGNQNTANGDGALGRNTIGNENTADGASALFNNTTGNNNTANGTAALQSNTTGSFNVALGNLAGSNLTTGDNNIDIGNEGFAGEANTIRIGDDAHQGATFIAAVYGVAVAGLEVVMDSSDHLGTLGSSRRFKDEIKPMDKVSETVLALKPVTFRYKKEIDPTRIPQFGLVAEDVEKVNHDLVVRDKEGKPYSVRYEAVNAMLLNEFLKEHRKVEALEANAARQQKEIEALTAGLQKVSAQLAAASPSRVADLK